MVAYYLNIGFCFLIVIGGVLWAKLEPDNLDKPFVKAALMLWLLRSAGFIAVYWRLLALHTSPLDWTSRPDPPLLLLADCATVFSLWTWLTLLRGNAYAKVGPKGTIVEMSAAWAIIIPLNLFLSFQHRTWVVLMPSGVLNFLSWGFAVAAAAFRYRKRSIPFIVIFTAYNSLQIPAYESALLGDPGPAPWIYYALAVGKLLNFVAIWHLLLGPVREEIKKPLLPLLGSLWPIGLVVAVVAALTHLLLHAYPQLDQNPLFLAFIILFNILAIGLAIRETIKRSRKPPPPPDDTRGRGASV